MEKHIQFPEMEFSSITFFLEFRKLILEVKKLKKKKTLKQCLIFSHKLKNLLYFRRELANFQKQTKNLL